MGASVSLMRRQDGGSLRGPPSVSIENSVFKRGLFPPQLISFNTVSSVTLKYRHTFAADVVGEAKMHLRGSACI